VWEPLDICNGRFFEFKQIPLFIQAASIAGNAAVFADDAMAGNDDAQGISTGVGSSGTNSLGLASFVGEIGVRDRFSIGDERDLPPDSFLKIGSGDVQRQGELGSLAREIFLKLHIRLAKNGMLSVALPLF